ncbi:KilA-N domain-containing protein [Pseudomonas purpurea]|uniref:KilA-N domain-containing protein n=1 Tax=Pseudomonas purpurea TaxID=3136737 RepID=UPI0032652A3C
MNIIDIKHKHADHLIIIAGQSFKASDAGMWNLTDIWQTLKLPKTKRPSRWRDRDAKAMERIHNLDTVGEGATPVTKATKRAALKYAAWVSPEFETMVYDAFEAILEMPEVALLVTEKMRGLGNDHSASLVERHVFNDRCDWRASGRRAPKMLTTQQKEIQKYQRHATYVTNNARKNGDYVF